jgi:hypothetical protein
MSSSSYLDNLQFATQQINLYGGLFVFITGIFGELLNLIIFTTLKTFRQTTCSFYLITTSIANIGFHFVLFLRILYDGFTISSSYPPLLCKFRFLLGIYWIPLSLTSMCLAIIDQFISMTTYKQWSNLRIARRLIAFVCILCFIISIFSFIYYDSYFDICIVTNAVFAKYVTYFQSPFLFGFIPIITMIIFSLLAFFKIRTIASRQINIVRLSRDRQLTAMTLFYVLFIIILMIPFLIFFAYTLTLDLKDLIDIAYNRLIYTITVIFYFISFSVSFFFKIINLILSLFYSVFVLYLLLCLKAFS